MTMARHISSSHCPQDSMRRNGSSKLSAVAQFLLITAFFNANVTAVCATIASSPELGLGSSIEGPTATRDIDYEPEKRTWQSLQGSWGKRGSSGSMDELVGEISDNWIPILIDNGNNELSALNPLLYLVNAATLDRLVRERQATDEGLRASTDFLSSPEDTEGSNGNNEMIAAEKRAWKSLNAGWGKRRNAPAWNKFSGAWGKREPGWNNLKGMWGKRAGKDWQKLHAGWGKRSQHSFADDN